MKKAISFITGLIIAGSAIAGSVDQVPLTTADSATSVTTNFVSLNQGTIVTSGQKDGYVESISLRCIQGLGVVTATSKVVIATVTNSYSPVSQILYSNLTFSGTDMVYPLTPRTLITSGSAATNQWGRFLLSADKIRVYAWQCNTASNTEIKVSVNLWQ